MANNLPYFRFFVQEWQNSKVSVENYKMQGLYINICAYYWVNDCDLTLLTLQKKFKDCKTLITEMIKNGLIKHEKKHNKIQIDFLNIQYDLLSEKRKLRQAAGMRGGNATALLKQKIVFTEQPMRLQIAAGKTSKGASIHLPEIDSKSIGKVFQKKTCLSRGFY